MPTEIDHDGWFTPTVYQALRNAWDEQQPQTAPPPPPTVDSDEPTFFCPWCESERPLRGSATALTGIGSSMIACGECLTYSHRCADCGRVTLEGQMYTDDGVVCAECFVENHTRNCPVCGNREVLSSYDINGIETLMCVHCFRRQYRVCPTCSTTEPADNMRSRGDNYMCSTCYDSGVGYFRGWREHDRTFRFFGDGTWHIGLELEVEAPANADRRDKDSICKRVIDSFGTADADDLLMFERDGSLENGIEIITRPMTEQYFDDNRASFTRMLASLQRSRCTSHQRGTCGLHVHVGRRAFGSTHQHRSDNIAKLILLTEIHWDDIVKLSRRTERTMEQWSKKYDTIDSSELRSIVEYSADAHGRYQAINVTNRNTVEFRFFRGTLNKDSFYGSVKLALAMVDVALALSPDTIRASESLRECLILSETEFHKVDQSVLDLLTARGL